VIRLRRLTRRRFLAAAVPALAALPAASVLAADDPDGPDSSHGVGGHRHGAPAAVEPLDVEGADLLLVPPPAEAAQPGRIREVELVAHDVTVEVAKGLTLDAWTYNGTVPGPIIRATEGDLLRVRLRNETARGHTVHFHGIHPTRMDGAFVPVPPGEGFLYELRAAPAGVHIYHCHVSPLAEHIARGLYGMLLIDPPEPPPDAQELVLVLSGLDLDGDEQNELYAANGRPFIYAGNPITILRDRPVRIYLANLTEYEPVSSFHLHAAFFRLNRTGTAREPEYTDTVTLAQGERCIIEPDFPENGFYMFHGHQSAMADRGWMGWFNVAGSTDEAARQLAGFLAGSYADTLSSCRPCIGTLGAKAITIY
jgi:FtsP/CotA-like multicopper oxidase with cupredoxin domain